MAKPKVYVTRILAQEGLQELRKVCELHNLAGAGDDAMGCSIPI
jgi:hypothetical protein